MEKKSPHSAYDTPTQVQGRPFSYDELEMVRRVAPIIPCRWKDVAHLFPGRTKSSVGKHLASVRKELGIGQEPKVSMQKVIVQHLDKNDHGADDGEFDARKSKWEAASQMFVERLAQERRTA